MGTIYYNNAFEFRRNISWKPNNVSLNILKPKIVNRYLVVFDLSFEKYFLKYMYRYYIIPIPRLLNYCILNNTKILLCFGPLVCLIFKRLDTQVLDKFVETKTFYP